MTQKSLRLANCGGWKWVRIQESKAETQASQVLAYCHCAPHGHMPRTRDTLRESPCGIQAHLATCTCYPCALGCRTRTAPLCRAAWGTPTLTPRSAKWLSCPLWAIGSGAALQGARPPAWSSTTARQRAASPVTPRASEEGGGTYRAREYEVRRRLIDLPLLFPFPFPKATNPSTDTATR